MQIQRPEPRFKMSDDAKRVFKGMIFDVYQWQQRMFDGSYTTFESLKRPDTAMVIPVMPNGSIMVQDEQQPGTKPYVALPGGRIEAGEDPLDSAKRELLEEAGLESDDWSLFYAVQPSGKIDWASYTFVARNCRKVAEQNLENGEKIVLRQVSLDEFIKEICRREFRDLELKMRLVETEFDPQKLAEFKKSILG